MSRGVYRELKVLVRRRRAPACLVQRARMILLAREGCSTAQIADTLGCTDRNVRKWKARFTRNPVLRELQDAPRSGRPAQIPLWVRCRLVQLACDRPEQTRLRDRWTHAALRDEVERLTGFRISESEVGRILNNAELRPHRVRQWLHSADPEFERKAKAICELYLNAPSDAVVLCVDEKPMQVLERRHPTHIDGRDGSVRYEFEYKRHGVQVLLSALDVGTGRVLSQVVPQRTADATVMFMERVARRFPNRDVYVVWDNLSSHYDGPEHRWTRFNQRHGGRFHFVYTPKHASWMNQVEIWFSILHRRVLQHGDFSSHEQQRDRVMAFTRLWNQVERHPFRWTWRVSEARSKLAA
jgi:transposase